MVFKSHKIVQCTIIYIFIMSGICHRVENEGYISIHSVHVKDTHQGCSSALFLISPLTHLIYFTSFLLIRQTVRCVRPEKHFRTKDMPPWCTWKISLHRMLQHRFPTLVLDNIHILYFFPWSCTLAFELLISELVESGMLIKCVCQRVLENLYLIAEHASQYYCQVSI